MTAHTHRAQVLEFWALIRAGKTIEDASACLGVNASSGYRWFRKAGGVMPPAAAEPAAKAKYHRLTIEEREQIHAGMERDEPACSIAARLDRATSTVTREIKRNLRHQRYGRPGKRGPKRSTPWNYSPHRAQLRADSKASRPGTAKLACNHQLREQVQARLDLKHSPEQISHRLRGEFPDDPEMRVSHETIYQSIYVQTRGALNRELAKCLRTGRALRKPRRSGQARRERIKDQVNISERPKEAADRAVPGHWEGDLIIGKNSGSAIGTLVERTTGLLMLLHLPDDHGALAVQEAMIDAMRLLPEQLRKTVAWDQGIEMANHQEITLATDVQIYFCDPAHPWQRATNENTNGLLRQYFPKSTDLSGYHPDYLLFVANQLNDRPRKRLDWQTPKEALRALLSDPTDPNGVALAG